MDARHFAAGWIAAWNARDLEKVLAHYAEHIELSSPLAARLVPESGGVIRGREALRAYWTLGLSRNPDLHFELAEVLEGVRYLVLLYRNQRGQRVAEALTFDEQDLVIRASIAHGPLPG